MYILYINKILCIWFCQQKKDYVSGGKIGTDTTTLTDLKFFYK